MLSWSSYGMSGSARPPAMPPLVQLELRELAEMGLIWRISRGRERCTATAAPCRAAAIARAMTSGRVAPIESVTRSGWQALPIQLVSWKYRETRVVPGAAPPDPV